MLPPRRSSLGGLVLGSGAVALACALLLPLRRCRRWLTNTLADQLLPPPAADKAGRRE